MSRTNWVGEFPCHGQEAPRCALGVKMKFAGGTCQASAVDKDSLSPYSFLRLSPQTLRSMPGPLPLVKGTLDILVLKTLTWGPMHGFEITTWLEQRSGGALEVEDSALYQALHRMEERGLVTAEWGQTDRNRKARYYRATADGLAFLKAETKQWARYAGTVSDILGARSKASAV